MLKAFEFVVLCRSNGMTPIFGMSIFKRCQYIVHHTRFSIICEKVMNIQYWQSCLLPGGDRVRYWPFADLRDAGLDRW